MAKIIISSTDGKTTEHGLVKQEVKLGRVAEDNDIVLDSVDASRTHCKLTREGNAWFVEDLKSTNGTRVNGRKVTKFELEDGDEIQVGTLRIQFLAHAEAESAGAPADLDLDLEIKLEDNAFIRFLAGPRANEKVMLSGRVTVGRNATNTLILTEKGISGNHSEFVSESGQWIVRDLGSTNGTLVNGEKAKEAKLKPGDVVKIGIVEFVFGEGQNEGAESLATVVMAVTEPIPDDVFAVSEANLKRRQSLALGGWLVLFLVLAVGAVVAVGRAQKTSTKSKPVMSVAGNLIDRGTSFEIETDGEEIIITESDAIVYEETIKYKNSGETSLELTIERNVPGTHLVVFKRPIPTVAPSDRLAMSAFFRTSSLTGLGGMALIWKDDEGRTIGTSEVAAPTGLGSFQEVKATFKPPFGAASAQAAVFARRASGKFQIDDISVVRLPTGDERGLVCDKFEVLLESNGTLSLARDSDEILEHAGFAILGAASFERLSDAFIRESIVGDDKKYTITGRLVDQEGGDRGRIEYTVERTETGARFDGKLEGDAKGAVFVASVEPGAGLATIAPDGARRHLDAFERSGVTGIVLESGPRAARISSKEPMTVAVKKLDRFWLVLPVTATNGGASFSIDMQIDFEKESAEVIALADDAQKAEIVERAYGKALKLQSDIFNRFPFRKDLTERAEQRIQEMTKRGETELAKLDARSRDIHFFKTYDLHFEAFNRDVSTLAASYAGSDIAKRAESLRDAMKTAWDELFGARRVAKAENHLLRAKDLLEGASARPALARGFLESVIDLAPESPLAAEAKEKLAAVEKAIAEKRQK